MGTLFVMIGFIGGIVFFIRLILALIKKKSKKFNALGILTCFVIFMIGGALLPPVETTSEHTAENESVSAIQSESASDNTSADADNVENNAKAKPQTSNNPNNSTVGQNSNASVSTTNEQNSSKDNDSESNVEYDKLQTLFLDIDETYSKNDILNAINNANLSYTEKHYNNNNTTIKVAYSDGVALQRYADAGDSLEISLDEANNNALMYMEYFNEAAFLSGVYYRYGTYWTLNFDSIDNDYVGYYISDSFGKNKGIVITYNNGNSTESNYFAFDSKTAVLDEIIQRNT